METDATHLDFGSAQSLTIVRSVDSDGATHRVKWYGALAVPVCVGSSDPELSSQLSFQGK